MMRRIKMPFTMPLGYQNVLKNFSSSYTPASSIVLHYITGGWENHLSIFQVSLTCTRGSLKEPLLCFGVRRALRITVVLLRLVALLSVLQLSFHRLGGC
jgi:hypothetical protein